MCAFSSVFVCSSRGCDPIPGVPCCAKNRTLTGRTSVCCPSLGQLGLITRKGRPCGTPQRPKESLREECLTPTSPFPFNFKEPKIASRLPSLLGYEPMPYPKPNPYPPMSSSALQEEPSTVVGHRRSHRTSPAVSSSLGHSSGGAEPKPWHRWTGQAMRCDARIEPRRSWSFVAFFVEKNHMNPRPKICCSTSRGGCFFPLCLEFLPGRGCHNRSRSFG